MTTTKFSKNPNPFLIKSGLKKNKVMLGKFQPGKALAFDKLESLLDKKQKAQNRQ